MGVRVLPAVVIAALLATLSLGMIGRTLPQLNVHAIGFGLNALLTFAMMFLSLGGAMLVFREHLEPALAMLLEMVKAPVNPMVWITKKKRRRRKELAVRRPHGPVVELLTPIRFK